MTFAPRSRPRSLLPAVVLALVAGVLGVTAPAEAGSRYLCSGYSGCRADDHSNAGYARNNDRMWWRMYSGHNCTNYAAYRMVKSGMDNDRPWSGSGNASNWGVAMSRITDHKPMVGAVAWWKANVPGAGSAGHVAYVERVITRRKIVVSEDSWGGDFHWRVITKRGEGWPSGFVHFNDRSVIATRKPSISGQPAVGAPLTVDPGRWKPSTTPRVQWIVGGKPVTGATGLTYTPTPDQVRKRVRVKVTAGSRGYLAGTATTPATSRVERGTMASASQPALSGTARVDEVLTLSPGASTPAAQSTIYRWFADGDRITGESGSRLRLRQGLIRKQITAVVVYRRDGYRNLRATTGARGPVKAGRIEIDEPFTVSGRSHIGRRISVEKGSYTPADAQLDYTWLRDGEPIAGAHAASYVATAADVGHRLTARVDLRRTGYRDRSVTLDPDALVTTTPDLRLRTVGRRHRVVVRLRVTAPGVDTPEGRVVVRLAGRRVRGELVNGRLRTVVRRLDPGRYRVRVRYQGTDVVRAKRATGRVRVPRR